MLLNYRYRGCLPKVQDRIIDLRLHASGVRDTVSSLHMRTDTVLSDLKKKDAVLESVHPTLWNTLNADAVTVDMERAGEAAMDDMGSFVGRQPNPRGRWHAIDHQTGEG